MAQTIEITTADKLSVVLFLVSLAYCFLLAATPSMPVVLLLLISIAGNSAWIFIFLKVTENLENQSVYSFLNIPSAIIWISLIAQAL